MDLSQYSDEQLMQFAGMGGAKPATDLSQYSDEDLMKVAGVQAKPGFIDRVAGDLTKRANEGADAIVAYRNGEQGLTQTGVQLLGKMGAGSMADIGGEAVRSAYTSLPDSAQKYIGDKASKAGNYIADTSIGNAGIEGARQLGEKYTEIAKNNPNAARTIESVADVASLLPAGKAVETVAQPVEGAAKTLSTASIANDIGTKLPSIFGDTRSGSIAPEAITRDMVRNAGSNAYKFADQMGAQIQPQLTDKALTHVENAIQKPFFGGKVLTSEQKSINDALSEFLPAKGQPATLRDFQALDSSLGDKASMAYIAGDTNKARIIGDVQDKVRDLMQPSKLAPGDVVGSTAGIDALTNHAIPLWSTQAKMADIEKIFERGSMMANPSTAIQTGLRNYALNEGKMAQLPLNVQKLIIKGANTGKLDDLLGIFGSRLNGIIGGAIGGIPGVIVSNTTSMTARGVRNSIKGNQTNAILNAMVEHVRPSIEKFK